VREISLSSEEFIIVETVESKLKTLVLYFSIRDALLIFTRCFCDECCNNWFPIEAYGYFNPVRICIDCKNEIVKNHNERRL
jgi:hypothetical protein